MDNHKEAKNISQSGIVNCQLSIVNCQLTMVDLHGQYLRLKAEIDAAIQNVIDSSAFINGPQVGLFAAHLADYLQVPHVIPCGNGTDALQIALMALDLQPGDEVVLPAFTYIAAAEVVALLGLRPVLVDVDARTFNLDARLLEAAITDKTRAVIVVHLFGQAADMEPILSIASKHHLYVIEDNAQSLGATYTFADGTTQRAGTIGHIGTTSFFPSKPLACYGDGGALMTRDNLLADRIRMIANHGQKTKYNHQSIGCNSRLDTLQAAVLDVKLRHLDEFTAARQSAAHLYDELLASCAPKLLLPLRTTSSTHVFHQYTVQIKEGRRDEVRLKLRERGIPSMVYYPLPVHRQAAYRTLVRCSGTLPVATALCESVLSLPIHTEMTPEMVQYIAENLVEIVQ